MFCRNLPGEELWAVYLVDLEVLLLKIAEQWRRLAVETSTPFLRYRSSCYWRCSKPPFFRDNVLCLIEQGLFSKRVIVTFDTWGLLGKHFGRPADSSNKPAPHGVSTLLVRHATARPVGSFEYWTSRNYHGLFWYFCKKGELPFYYPRQRQIFLDERPTTPNARPTARRLPGMPSSHRVLFFARQIVFDLHVLSCICQIRIRDPESIVSIVTHCQPPRGAPWKL